MKPRMRTLPKAMVGLAVVVSGMALTITPAQADNIKVEPLSMLPAFGASVVGGIAFNQYCQVARADVGVGGSGGITYDIVSHGEAVGTDVLDTSIGCKIKQGTSVVYTKFSNFAPGYAAANTDSWTTYSLASLSICSETKAFTSSGATVPGTWFGQNGQPCPF